MAVKADQTPLFESSVISYGSQTEKEGPFSKSLFESSVISYGSQTLSMTE